MLKVWPGPKLHQLGDFFRYVSAEGPGFFTGTAAERLGLSGQTVSPEALGNLARQLSPDGMERLGRRRPFGGRHLLVLEPKSTEVLPLLRPGARADIQAARQVGLKAFVREFESTCAWTRRGAGGHRRERGRGLLFMVWFHSVSRSLEPAPHFHIYWPNMVDCFDGSWTAVAGVASTRAAMSKSPKHGSAQRCSLYEEQERLGSVYRKTLRAELERRGYRTRDRRDFGFELDDVSERLLRHFSTRRRQVLAKAAELREKHGSRVPEHDILQWAAHSSRDEKPTQLALAELSARWRKEALEVEHDLAAERGRGMPLGPSPGLER